MKDPLTRQECRFISSRRYYINDCAITVIVRDKMSRYINFSLRVNVTLSHPRRRNIFKTRVHASPYICQYMYIDIYYCCSNACAPRRCNCGVRAGAPVVEACASVQVIVRKALRRRAFTVGKRRSRRVFKPLSRQPSRMILDPLNSSRHIFVN